MPQNPIRILNVIGSGSEAIRMAPVVKALAADPAFEARLCVTEQHSRMLAQLLERFQISPDFELALNHPGQDSCEITSRLLRRLSDLYQTWTPDIVLLHADSAITLGTCLSAYYARIKICLVESGAPTYENLTFRPEVMNRKLIGSITDFHMVPCEGVQTRLLLQGIAKPSIHITGNTLDESLPELLAHLPGTPDIPSLSNLDLTSTDPAQPLILVACAHPENFGGRFANICHALVILACRGDAQIVFPLDTTAKALEKAVGILNDTPKLQIIPPLEYLPLLQLMERSFLLITDSARLQEEAIALGKPVLLMRDSSALAAEADSDNVHLVGGDAVALIAETNAFLEDPTRSAGKAPHKHQRRGNASQRILKILKKEFS